jgi:hypothetical protein
MVRYPGSGITMVTDTKGSTSDLEGRKLRFYFCDGEICEATLLTVDVHENCPFGDDYADFVYDVKSTNRPEKYERDRNKDPKPVYSAEFAYLDHWEIVDSAGGRG